MAMEISNAYSNYTGNYTKAVEKKENVRSSEKPASADKTELTESTRKTASDELAYLSKKYDGITFVAANFQPGMRYGSLSTTNIAISPEFLKKMANDPELEKEYTDQFESMKKFDQQNIQSHQAMGRPLVAQGWAIDKDGGISKWGISEADNKRHYGQEMTDYANKIREQKAEKKKAEDKIVAKKKEKAEQKEALEEKRKASREEQEALKEKIDSDNRALLGDKYKGSEWFDASEDIILETADKDTNIGSVVGLNLDMKL